MSSDQILERVDNLAGDLGIPAIILPKRLTQEEVEELRPKLQAALDASSSPVTTISAAPAKLAAMIAASKDEDEDQFPD